MKITENISVTAEGYGKYKVTDSINGVSVVVPAWMVDECDTDDGESVEKLLERCRVKYSGRDMPRYNIVIELGSKGERYMIDDNGEWSCDPLNYRDAWEPEKVHDLLTKARELYVNAFSEEVEPFSF